MAKVCKFCNHDNDDALEFCDKCGAKLQVFHQVVVQEQRKPRKHYKINFALICFIMVILFLGYSFYLAFCPFVPEDKLDYGKSIIGTQNIISSIRNIPENSEHFNVSLYVAPESLSLYFTSLVKPSVLDKKEFDDDIIPRMLIDFPQDDDNKFILIYRGEVCGVGTRIEFAFRYNESDKKWRVEECFMGKLSIPWSSDKILSYVLEDYAKHPDMKKILKSELKMKRRGAHVNVGLKYDKKESSGKIKSFLTGVLNAAKELTGKNMERMKEQK